MSLKPLNQNDFQMKIIKDLGMLYPNQNSKNMIRYAIFECSKCKIHFKSRVVDSKRNKQKYCKSCSNKNKITKEIKQLNQDDFEMKIIEDTDYIRNKITNNRKAIFECNKCKKHFKINVTSVKHNKQKTCKKCCETNKIHGMSDMRIYNIWTGIKCRVNTKTSNEKNKKNYSSRGIGVCNEWKNSFESFYIWAINNGYKKTLTIDRIDNNKGYYPENCRWTDYFTQAQNKRKLSLKNTSGYKGVSKHSSSDEKFVARITYKNKHYYIGIFDSARDAAIAYDNFARKNNFNDVILNF